MDKKNLMPQAAQPIHRTTLGQLPPELAELSEEALSQKGIDASSSSASVAASATIEDHYTRSWACSYDGDDAE